MLVTTKIVAVNQYGFYAKMELTNLVSGAASMQEAQKLVEGALAKMGDERAAIRIDGDCAAAPRTAGDIRVLVNTTFEAIDNGHYHILEHEGLMSVSSMNEGRKRITDALYSLGDRKLRESVVAPETSSSQANASSSGKRQ